MHKLYRLGVICLFWGLVTGAATAMAQDADAPITLHPKNLPPVTGVPFEEADAGIRLKLDDDTYMSKPIPWGTLPQEDLEALLKYFSDTTKRENVAARADIEPFIAIPIRDKLARTDIGSTNAVPRLERPGNRSVFAALGGSTAGALMLLLLYAGNLYAAYEISVFRAQPAGLVCGISAALPILGPMIFLAMPRREPPSVSETYEMPDENLEAAIASEQAAPPPVPGAHGAPRHPSTQSVGAAIATANLPAAKVFARGQFTFNRRFFETQVPGFFAVVRPVADKDLVLTIKAARGNYIAERFSRITPNEAYITVRKGHASEEIIVPFNEIQEVQLKHKDS